MNKYPLLNNKKALMRAFQATTVLDGDGDQWIERPELPALLRNLVYFNKLAYAFEKMDANDDNRIDFAEFCASLPVIGLELSEEEAKGQFDLMDSNEGGAVCKHRQESAAT